VSLGGGKIKHVIIVVMENRTFDNMFQGFPGADTVSSGLGHDGKSIPLTQEPFEAPCDPDHSHGAWMKEYDGGKMDGFDLITPGCNGAPNPFGPTDATYNYGYLPRAEVQPYFDLATQFSLADRMFATQTGPSYPGHVYLVAGTTMNQTDDPSDPNAGFPPSASTQSWGCDASSGTRAPVLGPGGAVVGSAFPCFDSTTMADLLDNLKMSWKYYTNNVDYTVTGVKTSIDTIGFDAIHHIRYGPDWSTNITEDDHQIFADIANGTLPTMSWLNPPIVASDHPGGPTGSSNLGPDWNATLVNAIGESSYWDNTAILITWDDHGGWYDHVAPRELDDNGLGFRVPLIAISKYAKHGYVSHVQHEYGSLLRFTEEVLGLGTMNQTDVRSDDLSDMFDFNQTPPSYAPVAPSKFGTSTAALQFFEQLPHETGTLDPE
jgi:phospholipase C